MSRGFKFNFSEGERVLCYEPDPNKAKVLYDSKILECCVRRDGSRTKKTAEYLVHFYGWNSSWDRHVAEQNILKDNPDNRALQRQLAEIAAEQLKGKKLKLNKIPAIIKEVVVGLTPASSSSHQSHDSNSKDSNTSAKDKDEISMDEFDSNLCNTQSEINSDNNNLISENSQCDDGPLLQPSFLQLSDELKTILEKDAQFIDNGKSYSLPAKYTVKMILEKYLDDTNNFNNGNNSCSVSTRNRKSSASKEARLILKEFVTSLEMYFDTILSDHLLYSEEKRIDILSSTSSSSSHFKTPYSQIYGFIHLLRLLTVLPEFFAATPGITKKQLNILFKLFQEFIAFLTKNRSIFIDH